MNLHHNQANVSTSLQMSIQPIRTFNADALPVRVFATEKDMAIDVAHTVHDFLVETINQKGNAAAI